MSKQFYISLSLPVLTCLLFILVSISGCSSSEAVTESSEPQRDLSAMEEIYWERIKESRMNFTDADVEFMNDMIGHHSQALIMSRLAPENDASHSIQTLAARIINAQGDEINLMKRWLSDRDQPVPRVHIDGLNLMIHWPNDHGSHGHQSHGGHNSHQEMHDHSDMPGMLSPAELEELAAAKGREFDRLFLQYMIKHHEGALVMVQTLFAADGAAADREMFDLASGINAEQVTEIARMNLMLENIPDS